MKSRKVLLGIAGIAVLSAVSIVGALTGSDALVDVASTLLLAVVGVLVLDTTIAVRETERQLRRVKNTVRKAVVPPAPRETKPAQETAPLASPADLVGAIRLLQAQYVGRLDRAQATLEAAVEELSTTNHRED